MSHNDGGKPVFEVDFCYGWTLKIGNNLVADENGIDLQTGDFMTNKKGTLSGLATHIHQGASGPTSVRM